jgi:hypothetical protein
MAIRRLALILSVALNDLQMCLPPSNIMDYVRIRFQAWIDQLAELESLVEEMNAEAIPVGWIEETDDESDGWDSDDDLPTLPTLEDFMN